MSKFIKDNFIWDGEYLMYSVDGLKYGQTRKFVARFKRNKRDRVSFTNFLIKNFKVEEYFMQYDAGGTPTGILEEKGYVSATVKKMLKEVGFPQSLEGREMYLAQQRQKIFGA
jgi:hypothetical protein